MTESSSPHSSLTGIVVIDTVASPPSACRCSVSSAALQVAAQLLCLPLCDETLKTLEDVILASSRTPPFDSSSSSSSGGGGGNALPSHVVLPLPVVLPNAYACHQLRLSLLLNPSSSGCYDGLLSSWLRETQGKDDGAAAQGAVARTSRAVVWVCAPHTIGATLASLSTLVKDGGLPPSSTSTEWIILSMDAAGEEGAEGATQQQASALGVTLIPFHCHRLPISGMASPSQQPEAMVAALSLLDHAAAAGRTGGGVPRCLMQSGVPFLRLHLSSVPWEAAAFFSSSGQPQLPLLLMVVKDEGKEGSDGSRTKFLSDLFSFPSPGSAAATKRRQRYATLSSVYHFPPHIHQLLLLLHSRYQPSSAAEVMVVGVSQLPEMYEALREHQRTVAGWVRCFDDAAEESESERDPNHPSLSQLLPAVGMEQRLYLYRNGSVEQCCGETRQQERVERVCLAEDPSLLLEREREEEGPVGQMRFHEWLHCWRALLPVDDDSDHATAPAAPSQDGVPPPPPSAPAPSAASIHSCVAEPKNGSSVNSIWLCFMKSSHDSANEEEAAAVRCCLEIRAALTAAFHAAKEENECLHHQQQQQQPEACTHCHRFPVEPWTVAVRNKYFTATLRLVPKWVSFASPEEDVVVPPGAAAAVVLIATYQQVAGHSSFSSWWLPSVLRQLAATRKKEDEELSLLYLYDQVRTDDVQNAVGDILDAVEEADELEVLYRSPTTEECETDGVPRLVEAFSQYVWPVRQEHTRERSSELDKELVTAEQGEVSAMDGGVSPCLSKEGSTTTHRIDTPQPAVASCALPSTFLVDPRTLRSTQLTALRLFYEEKEAQVSGQQQPQQDPAQKAASLSELQSWSASMQQHGHQLPAEVRRSQAGVIVMAMESFIEEALP